MTALIPWRTRQMEATGNGGPLSAPRDFPLLMRRMQSEFDELFNRFARSWPLPADDLGPGWSWGLEVDDKGDRLVLRAEAPGFEADDFDLRISGDRLVLRASHQTKSKEKGVESREEFECYESVSLPSGIDRDKIDAKYHNGVLTVTIPKTKEARGKKIAVKNA